MATMTLDSSVGAEAGGVWVQIPDVTTITVSMVERPTNRGMRCWFEGDPKRVTVTVRYSLGRESGKAYIEAAEAHTDENLTEDDQRNLARVLLPALERKLGARVVGWKEWWQHIYAVPYEPRKYDAPAQGVAA